MLGSHHVPPCPTKHSALPLSMVSWSCSGLHGAPKERFHPLVLSLVFERGRHTQQRPGGRARWLQARRALPHVARWGRSSWRRLTEHAFLTVTLGKEPSRRAAEQQLVPESAGRSESFNNGAALLPLPRRRKRGEWERRRKQQYYLLLTYLLTYYLLTTRRTVRDPHKSPSLCTEAGARLPSGNLSQAQGFSTGTS